MFAKRPKRGEDDEDLQRFQEEFLKNTSGAPSAKVVRVNKEVKASTPAPSPVKPLNKPELQVPPAVVEDVSEDVTPSGVVMDRVVEKSNVSAFLRSFSPVQSTSGFPSVPKLSADLLNEASSQQPRKKSLFRQQIEAKSSLRKGARSKMSEEVSETPSSDMNETSDMASMMSDISKENEAKLAQMSTEEIIAEQQQLAQALDPNLLQLLKNRSKSRPQQKASASQSAMQTKTETDQSDATADDVEMKEATKDGQGTSDGMVKDKVTPLKTDDLPFQPDSKWLHMDQLEHEKLQWLKPLDEKKSDKGDKLSARFDFNGNLVNETSMEVDTSSGLHHHGDDPESAGYTLEELYILVRSLNTSQKTLALSTLANVLRKAKRGDYLYQLNNSITKALLEADIVLLLRYALDERSDLVVAAAVNAWHNLLCNHHDLKALQELNCSLFGHWVPQLTASDLSPPQTDEEQVEREEEQYIEVLKRDVVSGLLMMDFLPRLRYLLEVGQPQQKVCSQIIDIISRMIMTSSEVAYNVYLTPRLVKVIFDMYLPMTFTGEHSEGDVGSGRPLVEAMRCTRYLCASGRSMALELITKHSLMERIIRYVSSDDSREFGDSYKQLMVESLLTWRSIVLYGLALDHYHVVHASLVTRLQRESDPHISSSLVCLLSAFLSAAATEEPAKTVRFSDLPDGGAVEPRPSQLQWTHVAGLVDSVYGLSMGKMKDFIDTFSQQRAGFDLDGLVSSLDFVSLYLTHMRVQPVNLEGVVSPHTIVDDVAGLVQRLIKSTAWSCLLSDIRKWSVLLRTLGYITTESHSSLPSMYTVEKPVNEEVNAPDVNSQSTKQILLLKAILFLIHCCLKLDPARVQPHCVSLLHHVELTTYIKRLSQSASSNAENFISLVECSTLVDLCQLAAAVPTSHLKDIHRCSLSLVSRCSQLSDLCSLFVHSVFNADMFRSSQGDDNNDDPVLVGCVASLPSISNTYVSMSVPVGNQLQVSRYLKSRDTSHIQKMLVQHRVADLLPSDWPFMPIMHLYQTSNSRDPEAKLPPDTHLLLKSCLQFIYLLEKCHPDVIKSVGTHAKLARVMCSFLLDNDLFLEPDMQTLLMALFKSYSQNIRRINFNLSTPGLFSFSELYAAFVDQFEATSFGNNVFAHYLLLPMMQQQLTEYRKMVWTEHGLALRSIQITPEQLELPIEELLYPEETDTTIVMHMCRHLLAGTITPTRNHLLYVVALHHVNRFMFTNDGKSTDIKQTLLKSAHRCTTQPLKDHLIFYKQYRVSADLAEGESSTGLGVVCYSKLPIGRCNILKSVQLG